jgi:GLPGLI family protein
MNKIITKSTLTFILLFIVSAALVAGKPFDGVITYKISYPDSKLSEAQLNMFPKVMTVSIKGSKARTEINVGGGPVIAIVDYVTKSKITLINMMGQKFAIKQTAEELAKENASQPKGTVTITNETKNITGYTCKKAIVTTDDDGVKTTFEVWFTDEIGGKEANFDDPVYQEIPGVMMEFVMKTPQTNMKLSATSVEKKAVSAKDFEIPADYTLTTQEELKSKFGGGGE